MVADMAMPAPTPRLTFRELTLDDLDDMAGLLGDPQVMRHYRSPRPARRRWPGSWITWNQRLYREHGFGLWLLTLRATGEFVDDCGLILEHVDGVTACRDDGRDVLGADRVIAIIGLRNRPSQRVAEKLGLALERQTDNPGRWPSPQLI